MKRGVILGACALVTSYQTHHLLTAVGILTATKLLEIFALAFLTVTFLWFSLSYILLFIGEKHRHTGLLTIISRCGSPQARHLATIALLLAPTSACTLAPAGNDVGAPITGEYSIHTQLVDNQQKPLRQTSENLQRQYVEPAILQRNNSTLIPLSRNVRTTAVPDTTTTVTVVPGDCLWSIAQRLNPKFSNSELAQFVQRLYRKNSSQITDPHIIYPGQILQLPTTES